jgi:hypothetical protein
LSVPNSGSRWHSRRDDFADLRLAALHRALDLVGLVQRAAGMHGDLELAAGGLVDVGGELGDVLGVEVGGRVGVGMSHLVWAEAARAVKPSAAASSEGRYSSAGFLTKGSVKGGEAGRTLTLHLQNVNKMFK